MPLRWFLTGGTQAGAGRVVVFTAAPHLLHAVLRLLLFRRAPGM